jgi:PAS domain-containing protein
MELAMLEIPSPDVLQAIVDRLETGVFAVDLDRKISYWNFGAEKITGFLSFPSIAPMPPGD